LTALLADHFGYRDREDPRFDLFRLDRRRKVEGPMERAIGPFHPKKLFSAHRVCQLALALQRYTVVVDTQLNVVLIHPGQLGFEDQVLIRLVEVDRW